MNGEELDADTRAFIEASGAAVLGQHGCAPGPNPVADLERLVSMSQTAADDRTAICRVAEHLRTRLRAATLLVIGPEPERRVIVSCGRQWSGDPSVAWQAIAGGVSVSVDRLREPCQAAEPLRYSGEIIGSVAARWTPGSALDPARVGTLLRMGALAIAPNVRAELDRGVPIPAARTPGEEILGESEAAKSMRESIARAARAPFPVLIEGESGSGKELVARAIHRLGPRRDRRFCAINCAALSDELLEAELFGHARGAFTGAVSERAGLFEEADGGTLFLDEIGELSPRAQAKLLRVLQDGQVRRVGENMSRRVDVRIVAATNRRLAEEAAAGRFRTDLRFRLDVIRIDVPPLRDRAGDVALLASVVLDRGGRPHGLTRHTLARDARRARALRLAGERPRAAERDCVDGRPLAGSRTHPCRRCSGPRCPDRHRLGQLFRGRPFGIRATIRQGRARQRRRPPRPRRQNAGSHTPGPRQDAPSSFSRQRRHSRNPRRWPWLNASSVDPHLGSLARSRLGQAEATGTVARLTFGTFEC